MLHVLEHMELQHMEHDHVLELTMVLQHHCSTMSSGTAIPDIVDIIYLSRNSENCTLFSVLILLLLEWLPDWMLHE